MGRESRRSPSRVYNRGRFAAPTTEVLVTQTPPDAAEPIRMSVLRQLAEQAMSDLAFREVARHDLATALTQFGYDLNPTEMALVLRFRDSLEEAGVDLFLQGDLDDVSKDFLRDAARSIASGH